MTRPRRQSSILNPQSSILSLVLIALLAACGKHEPKKYNVLLITLDTFRADRLGKLTPNLSALDGVRFANAQSPVPLTLPAHASLLSGELPVRHGVRNNGVASFPADRETLATLLSHGGYRTGAFVSAFVLDHRFGLDRGFDTYDDAIERDPNATSSFDAERRGADTVDRALAWLRGSGDGRPFFAWVHLYDAHAPYAPPAPLPPTYDGEIAYVDAQVGRLLGAIDRASTIVVVAGDHGEALGEHGELTHGLLLYEPTLRVPWIIAGPEVKGRSVAEPVSSVDLAPTVAALAGVEMKQSDGRDLSKALIKGDDPPPADLYAETEYPVIFGWSDLSAMRRGAMKLISSPKSELYDVAHDPGETRNVLNDERRSYRDLTARLEKVRATAAPTARPSALDAEARAKLASLGYVAPPALATPQTGPRPAPAEMAPLFRAFEEATWATNEGRLGDAIAMLRPIVERDPRNPVFRASLARALRQKGDLGAAIQLYQEAVAMNPDDPETWYNLAVTLQEAGRTREGGIAIREAIRRDPKRPEAHNALGIAYSTEGNMPAAEAEFVKAIEIDPRDARAFNNLGNVLRAAGRADDAAKAYEQALAVSPNYVDALNGLGVLEVQRDRPRIALRHFDRALQLAPHFYEAQLNRGIALQLAGDRAEAVKQFQALLAELPRDTVFDPQRRAATQLLSALERQRG
ncbi:MAG TPA: tetratricopeptide repeat protein [Thermoanaerobaculia bacterium]|nr:tetratricopeptide repeat protein [Thermoanaerobaculia bacterium]